VPQHGHQDVVEVVRDPAGQHAQALKFLRLPNLLLQIPLLFLGQLAVGNVTDNGDVIPSLGGLPACHG